MQSHTSLSFFSAASDSPGFNLNFESAPFKLTRDYIDVMGGVDSAAFRLFEDLFLKGFTALRGHVDNLSAIIQVKNAR